MRSVIQQSLILPASAERLYSMYLDPALHAAITGAPVTISSQPQSEFSAFGGASSGRMLGTLPTKLIVQSWRANQFLTTDPDSTLILSFQPAAEGGQIDLLPLDVPDHDYVGVTEGWEKYYWTPWREYLETHG